jgi:hypothetical protein
MTTETAWRAPEDKNHASVTTEYGKAELAARNVLIGPHELIDQARRGLSPVMVETDYSALEVRTLAQLDEAHDLAQHRRCTCAGGSPRARSYTGPHVDTCPLSPLARQNETRSGFGTLQAGGAALIDTMRAAREQLDEHLPQALAAITRSFRELHTPARPVLLVVDTETRDAMPLLAHHAAPIVSVTGSALHALAAREWYDEQVKAEEITAPKRKRFKQARAPGEARNPMPPHTFKRRG